MNFPLYVARRYLFSKKSTNAINVISVISVIGVAVATMALVIVLSVFNGFHDLVATFFTNFDPQLEVVPTQGKTAPSDDPLLAKMKALPEVDVATESVEDQALAIYQDHQAMVIVKGVDDNFDQLTHIKDILFGDGTYSLHAGNLQYGIMGIRLAAALGTGARFGDYLRIYAPQKEGQFDATNPSEAFVVDSLLSPGVVFSVNQSKYDKNYIIAPIAFARNLFGQQADTFKIMQIEKYIAYIFLTFILIVACFNIIGSLSMLIIDKKEDVVTLRNLGANDRQISQIFLFEGRLIGVAALLVATAIWTCFARQ